MVWGSQTSSRPLWARREERVGRGDEEAEGGPCFCPTWTISAPRGMGPPTLLHAQELSATQAFGLGERPQPAPSFSHLPPTSGTIPGDLGPWFLASTTNTQVHVGFRLRWCNEAGCQEACGVSALHPVLTPVSGVPAAPSGKKGSVPRHPPQATACGQGPGLLTPRALPTPAVSP